jgi:glutaredoxin
MPKLKKKVVKKKPKISPSRVKKFEEKVKDPVIDFSGIWKADRESILIGAFIIALVLLAGIWAMNRASNYEDPSDLPVVNDTTKNITVVVFHGETCPFCKNLLAYLRTVDTVLQKSDINLVVEDYEVWNDQGNQALMQQVAAKSGQQLGGVPVIIVNTTIIMGYNEEIASQIFSLIMECSESDCHYPLELLTQKTNLGKE